MRAKVLLRLAAVAALALPLVPLQALALRLNWRLADRLPVFFHRCILRIIGVSVKTLGREDNRRPLLIVANHVSWLDIIVFGAAAPLSFIAKSEVATWPVLGLFARLQRSFFVERQSRHKTGAAASGIGERLKQGDAMLLFAEGTTGDGIHVLPFRSALLGAARTAMGEGEGAVFVQPVAIRYVRRDGLPIGRGAMPAISWAGDLDLVPHLVGILAGGPIDVVVSWGEVTSFARDTDRKALAKALEVQVRTLVATAA
jgi:1-acyl-sn-glycerol-3-phosphate acyltransferase